MPRPRPAVVLFAAMLLGACGEADPGPGPGDDPTIVIQVTGGNEQSGPANTELPVVLRAKVTANGVAAAGRTVSWSASGGASVGATSATDAAGEARTVVRLGPAGAVTVTASTAGAAPASFSLQSLPQSQNPVLVGEVDIPPLYGVHDSFVRDGIAFVCAWNSGVIIYDVGDGRSGGSPSKPREISRLVTSDNGVPGGAAVHNAWWFHDPNGEKRYLFIGQEGPATLFTAASGDVHVVDVSDLAAPREVAFLKVPGAGAHNFWMDEPNRTLYAAYYNGGVIAVDVSGTLSGDISSRIKARTTPGGAGNTFVWGVQLAGGALWVNDIVSGFWRLDPVSLAPLGGGNNVAERWGSDLWVHGAVAYTGTWGGTPRNGTGYGDAIKIWSLTGTGPTLVDSVVVPAVRTISDLAVTDDGRSLVVTTERLGGQGLLVYDLTTPTRPVLRGSVAVSTGLHTGTVAKIAGRYFVFAAKNPANPTLQIYDITP